MQAISESTSLDTYHCSRACKTTLFSGNIEAEVAGWPFTALYLPPVANFCIAFVPTAAAENSTRRQSKPRGVPERSFQVNGKRDQQ